MKQRKAVRRASDEWSDLQSEYEKMAYVVKALGGGIWDFDVTSGTLICSRRWHEILGLDYDTQQVRSIDEFKPHIHPDDVERATEIDMEEIGRLIARDERYAIDFRIIHADGKPRWIRSVASLVSGAGAGPRAVGCITDITALVGSWSPPHANGTADIKARGRRVRTRRKKPGMNLRPVSLSDHEIECLRWVSLGKTAKETAVILGKSARTVEFHLNNAMRKLNAVNKVQAVFLAVGLNLL